MQTPALLVDAHFVLGQPLFFLGEFSVACEHFEQSIALYSPLKHNPYVSGFAQDSGVACLSFVAWILWLRGYPNQALQKIQEALALARELSHPFSVAYALLMAARFHFFRREAQAAWERAEALIVLCARQGFALRMAQGTIFRGWALSMQGQGEEGIAQLREGMTTCRATGAEFFRASYFALLAEAYQKMGQVEEGLDALVEALAVVDNTGERLWEAELYRLRGDLTLQEANQKAKIGTSSQPLIPSTEAEAEAEACFHKAIEIAQRQQAKSLELRAVMSLVRLRQQQMTQLDSRTTHRETRTNLDVAHKMLVS